LSKNNHLNKRNELPGKAKFVSNRTRETKQTRSTRETEMAGATFLWMTPFVFLDRERSEVHHGLDNLNTELPLPDPRAFWIP